MAFLYRVGSIQRFAPLVGLVAFAACAHPGASTSRVSPAGGDLCKVDNCDRSSVAPMPDPRVGLKAGMWDAAQAEWNMHLVSNMRPPADFVGKTNSDLAFLGNLVIQGNYNGFEVWDITNPAQPTLKTQFVCPGSQSDVSIYKNLLIESAESPATRLDCGTSGVKDPVSQERMRGVRIWDVTDITKPKLLTDVQTCRGSHTHTLLVDPKDHDNIYIYISGSSFVRPAAEMAGCVDASPDQDPNGVKFRIEVIKVPLAHPEQAAIVSSPRIFQGLDQAPAHGQAPEDIADVAKARANGGYVASFPGGQPQVIGPRFIGPLLDSLVKVRGGTGTPTAADSAALHANLQDIITKRFSAGGARVLGTSCHDITVYPQLGLAGGACEGHGLLLDISDPAHPTRLDAAADSNFSYWHSATFNNDGTKILFSDEWGGGGAPKCRATDPRNWGADAIFTIVDKKMVFQSYYKLPAVQTSFENCVAHNGSLIPIPGRDIMVQAWYQGGISVFDWTDAKHPTEIAFFDRGPSDSTRMGPGGSWSAYWYNGYIISSEIARGLDILELKPSVLVSANEIAAAKTVRFDEFNTQGQPAFVWPTTFALARAYLDQLERSKGLSGSRISSARSALSNAEHASSDQRRDALSQLATQLDGDAQGSSDGAKVRLLANTVRSLATTATAATN
ncbi:MAG TPA: hypothetical protein VNV25_10170 [Gemmatimonadaceae bacterium]|nr:hypothetical protein [Gemmatimonadaceae bacterium]